MNQQIIIVDTFHRGVFYYFLRTLKFFNIDLRKGGGKFRTSQWIPPTDASGKLSSKPILSYFILDLV